MPYRDNTDEAAQAADDHWSEFGDGPDHREKPEPSSPIEIFGSAGCGFCVKAKDLCVKYHLDYTYKDVDEDEEAFFQLHGRIGSWKTVPQIFVGPKHVGGYDNLVKYLDL